MNAEQDQPEPSEAAEPQSEAAEPQSDVAASDERSVEKFCRSRIQKAELALRMVPLNLPHLSGLAHTVRLVIDARIDTAAVTPSGRVMFNPAFLDSLSLTEAMFVTAHELYHLVLETHLRREEAYGRLANIAHDLIINDILETELGMVPPAGALRCRGARHWSLERLMLELRQRQEQNRLPNSFWRTGKGRNGLGSPLEQAMDDAQDAGTGAGLSDRQKLSGGLGPVDSSQSKSQSDAQKPSSPDALTRQQELELFPLDNPADVARRIEAILEVSIQSVALSSFQHNWSCDESNNDDDRSRTDRATTQVEMLRAAYRTPWERVVQRWLDAQMPQPRSYSRPSRRMGDRTDVVLPGRVRDSWIIHVVLDTSGSMWPHLPQALGALAVSCEAAGVESVRLVQCDAGVTIDEIVPIEELGKYRIKGFTGREGQPVRKAFEPPPPPRPVPPPRRPEPPPLRPEPYKPEPQRDSSPEPRRRNKVVSRRSAHVSAKPRHRHSGAGHQKKRRFKLRKGAFVGVRIRNTSNTSNPSAPQDISLDLKADSPKLSMRVSPDSNLAPALRRLADEPEVEAVLVLTDGEIEYPEEPMPYEVLWLLIPSPDDSVEFEPDYGHVVRLESVS